MRIRLATFLIFVALISVCLAIWARPRIRGEIYRGMNDDELLHQMKRVNAEQIVRPPSTILKVETLGIHSTNRYWRIGDSDIIHTRSYGPLRSIWIGNETIEKLTVWSPTGKIETSSQLTAEEIERLKPFDFTKGSGDGFGNAFNRESGGNF